MYTAIQNALSEVSNCVHSALIASHMPFLIFSECYFSVPILATCPASVLPFSQPYRYSVRIIFCIMRVRFLPDEKASLEIGRIVCFIVLRAFNKYQCCPDVIIISILTTVPYPTIVAFPTPTPCLETFVSISTIVKREPSLQLSNQVDRVTCRIWCIEVSRSETDRGLMIHKTCYVPQIQSRLAYPHQSQRSPYCPPPSTPGR